MTVPVIGTYNQSVVILGVGNPHYSDSGIGARIVDEVATWLLPDVLSLNVHQLTPDLCKVLASADFAVVVNASRINKLHGVTVKPITAPALNCFETTTKRLIRTSDPRHLTALTSARFGQYPQTFWMRVPADDFFLGHRLSPIAEQGLETALTIIKSMIQVRGLPQTAC